MPEENTPPTTPAPAPAPVATTPPAPSPTPPPAPAATPSADPGKPGGNDENKYRRLFEDADKRAKDLEAKEKERTDAELSEAEKLKKRADEAESKVLDLTKRTLAAEGGLPSEMVEFITATDEAGIKAQVEKLAAKLVPPATPPTVPVIAGTTTNPPGGQQPSVDEQIAEAYKNGNRNEAIRLKRQKAGLSG